MKSLWRRRSERRVGERTVTYVKQRKGWRMSCEVGKAREGLENELCRRWSDGKVGEWARAHRYRDIQQSSFPKLSVTSPTSQLILILKAFRHFTYVTAHYPTLPSIYLRHNTFSNPSVASPMSQIILQPFFRLSYVTGFSLPSPGEPPMMKTKIHILKHVKFTKISFWTEILFF